MEPSTLTRPIARTLRANAPAAREIIHIDMDAFFASVEQLDVPALRGKPVAVGGDPKERGVVAAASYEARRFGVRSAMPMSQALRLCPDLVRVDSRIGRYIEVSRRIQETLRKWTPHLEMGSLDEAYLDVSDADMPAAEIAARLKRAIFSDLGLTASAGVGPCKLVAKIASDMNKPDGLLVVRPASVRSFLAPLPASRLPGVGPATERKLEAMGIRTIGDLAGTPQERVAARLGPSGITLIRLALGQDDRPVISSRRTRSISCERTLAEDTRDVPTLDRLITRFAPEIGAGLRDEKLKARTITVKVRYSDFRAVTRSRTVRAPIDDAAAIAGIARELLSLTGAGHRKVRLIGVSVSGLVGSDEPLQQPLFSL